MLLQVPRQQRRHSRVGHDNRGGATHRGPGASTLEYMASPHPHIESLFDQIAAGRERLARQLELIAGLQACGAPTGEAEARLELLRLALECDCERMERAWGALGACSGSGTAVDQAPAQRLKA
jgi:hypothetical protein